MVPEDNERILRRAIAMKKQSYILISFLVRLVEKKKLVLNQRSTKGQIGPAMQLEKELNAEVTHTIICGDNYIGTNTDVAVATILGMLGR